MELTFLGTSADTAFPLAFCDCQNCCDARASGGKSLRRRSSVMIDDDLVIDLGPDSVLAGLQFGRPFSRVRHILQTHPHSDHFDPSHLLSRASEYGSVNTHDVQIFASELSLKRMNLMARALGFGHDLHSVAARELLGVMVRVVSPLQTFRVGRYDATAFESNHDDDVGSLIFSLEGDGSRLLYATDTDSLPERTWAGLSAKKLTFDVVVLDHTYGFGADGGGHLNAVRFGEHLERMRLEGVISSTTRVFATHLSHEGHPAHGPLSDLARGLGYEIPWDGMTIRVG